MGKTAVVKAPRTGWRKWAHRVSHYLTCVLIGAIVWCLVAQIPWPFRSKIVISPQTTYLTGPIGPDGLVDYHSALREWYGRGVTPDNNAAVLLERIVRPSSCEPTSSPATAPSDPSRYQEDRDAEDASDRWLRVGEGIFDKDIARIRTWVDRNSAALAVAVEASRRPRYYTEPVDCGFSVRRDVVLLLRALACRGLLRAHSGQTGAGWEDLLACCRLARLMAPLRGADLFTIGRIESAACNAAGMLAAEGKLPAGQARGMLADLDALPPWPSWEQVVEYGRFSGLRWIAEDRPVITVGVCTPEYDGPWEYRFSPGFDRNSLLREINQNADRMRLLAKMPLHELADMMDAEVERYTAQQNSSMSCLLPRLLFTGWQRTEDWCLRGTCRRPDTSGLFLVLARAPMRFDLARLALALAAFRAENGQYPPTLEKLVPAYLPAVPRDIFVGRPLTYRPRHDGYLLYSVGFNRKDDGGRADRSRNMDDLVVQWPPARLDPASATPARPASLPSTPPAAVRGSASGGG